MRKLRWTHYYLGIGLATLAALPLLGGRPAPGTAAEGGPAVSSYGYMQTSGGDGKPLVLPLKHTDVKAEIVGVMSSVLVTQHFTNPSRKPIEAVYVFPLPHRAAIHAMTMRVGPRVITAQIKRRGEAKATYERAKKRGQTASLLEQERDNVFTQSVANIMPGDEIKVELRYVEELVPEEGRYEFVFPMVVGPRYMGEAKPLPTQSGAGWAADTERVRDASRISPPLLGAGVRPGRDISVSLTINAGVALSDIRVPSHKTSLDQPARDMATIQLDPSDRIPNRDFVVSYRLTGARPEATLLAGRSGLGGHFLLMVQPKERPAQSDLAPKEYYFVVDTSGSMEGVPLSQVQAAMKRCLQAMRPDDRFQIVRFAGDADTFARTPIEPTPENIARGLAFVDGMSASGGTEFIPALELALKSPRDPARARIVAFMTDGYIGYEAEVLRFIRQNLAGASVFSFGVGSSVNRYLIDGMARIGGGEPFVLLSRENEEQVVRRFFDTVSRPSLTNLSVDWGGLAVQDVTPARIPDLFADRPVVLAGRYARGGSGEITLRGHLAGAPYEQKLKVALPETESQTRAPALGYLWARRSIAALMDVQASDEAAGPSVEKQVTALALRYSLMSQWTAFVAVDRVVRNRTGSSESHAVPVPLPEDVGEKAAPATAFIQASLSSDQIAPGDPEVVIAAPPDAEAVTLFFPTGEVKACRLDPATERWRASFLIPEGTPDGVYAIRVRIELRDGRVLQRTVRYQVDGSGPRVRVRLEPAEVRAGELVRLRVEPLTLGAPSLVDRPVGAVDTSGSPGRPVDDIGDPTFDARVLEEIATAEVLLPSGVTHKAQRGADGTFALTFAAPDRPGRYALPVVARDAARNKSRHVVWLTVVE